MRKVLIANRGEIAVRVARACRDAGLASVAVYAAPDRDAVHVRIADEAYSLEGSTPGDSYLVIDKLLAVAAQSGADAVHPGYGFLSENADFAEAVINAGLTWIGPPPSAIRSLGDKVTARHIAERVGAPLVPGTPEPVPNASAVVDFARVNGLPIAIKAAFGGGGRGMKVARTMEEIPELYDSAVREAVTAFGRGECFVERYLDRPRHVETQCLADQHGNVVVISTRDCSLQRRHQKVVEEAPAPFLSGEQLSTLYSASKAILREAGYVGAGTCEFLVGVDGTISFLEVNTRLQVEHPVSEEVAGIDLVLEQFRLADGEPLGYDDPEIRGHSIEFRINGEDPSKNWMPAPGRITRWRPPTGPGVRVDTGVGKNSEVSGAFDSLLCKLIVTGATRDQAIGRARRALAEFQLEGLPTALPFHRALMESTDFTDSPFRVHTRWIETEADLDLVAYAGPHVFPEGQAEREHVVVEVGGKRLEVVIPDWVTAGAASVASASGRVRRPARRKSSAEAIGGAGGSALTAPMQGTIVKVAVEDGQEVAKGDLIVVLEAMKMEQPLMAPKAGVVSGLTATVGSTVASGTRICEITAPSA